MEFFCRTVRSSAAFALGKLSALSTRIDPLVGDLLTGLQVMINVTSGFLYIGLKALNLMQLVIA